MMTETKAKHTHTPGPWAIGYGGRDGDDYATITSPHADYPICDLQPIGYNAANAKLIAAAPAMLEACERALSLLREARRIACSMPMMDSPLVTEIQTAGGAVMALQDAIAAATE